MTNTATDRLTFKASEQEIVFHTAFDGAQLACTTLGSGPALVKAPNWLTHLDYDWETPIWRHLHSMLTQTHRVTRFDQRGNGRSDWDVQDISFAAFLADLETVVEAEKLIKFPLLGISQGCAISIAYAVRHPERVSHLVLYGGFARGPFKRALDEQVQARAMLDLIARSWGRNDPVFQERFGAAFMPNGTPDQLSDFLELQRKTMTAENAARIREVICNFDVADLLSQVRAPTLILHRKGDAVVPFSESAYLAEHIPNARLVALEGDNHLMFEEEQAWSDFVRETHAFLGVA